MVQSLDEARRRSRSGPRIPPHDLPAEESLLGAMLLSRDAIASAVEGCTTEDFYKPAHAHVFDAICALYGQGEPVDPVTVADELRRAGLLDAIGGAATLISLQAATPATSSAARYAHIVADHALLRRLIGVAGEISEMGYDIPDDVSQALDRAEAMVFNVAQRKIANTLAPIRDLLADSLDRLEALYDRGDSITGVPTGYHDLDEQLSGLQPSALIVVGARPSMGKAQPVDTPVLTPSGWRPIGELAVGDEVIGSDGRPTAVLGVFPQGVLPVYRVTLSDRTTTRACGEHLWSVHGHNDRAEGKPDRIVTTLEIAEELAQGRRRAHHVRLVAPVQHPPADLPLDPYLLGTRLGNGSFRKCSLRFASTEPMLAEALEKKHVPDAYLRGSVEQRVALLQGLLDAGGRYGAHCEFTSPSGQLAGDLAELARGLGGVAEVSPTRTAGLISHEVRLRLPAGMAPFRLPSKLRLWAADGGGRRRAPDHRIVSVEPEGDAECVCIQVAGGDHLYVTENHIVTHNTAFALGLAAHAAMEAQRTVLFFSLEMSHLEITQRLLCAEARVDATRMRNGRLIESDWSKISHAIGRLGEAPIFIDDNPNVTVMDIRAKARRLKSREDLGLVVVDYLQLMSGRTNAENRQVEVSEISRGLKILARELEVPVVALSQLSRNLESRADKRPMLADLRESGCLTADTRVLRADTGAEVSMGELLITGERNIPVWTVDGDMRLTRGVMTHVFASGVKRVFELRLASGHRVKASANHPFLTVDGWRRLDELSAGSRVAAPRRVPDPGETTPWPEEEVVALAHLLGDGRSASRQPVLHTGADEGSLAGARRAAWLEPMGLGGLRDHQRFLPRQVFSLPDGQVRLFLRHLWATAGSLAVDARRGRARLSYATTSQRLADDVQRLLLRVGITSRQRTVSAARHRPGYTVDICGAAGQLAFLREVGIHGQRGRLVPYACRLLEGRMAGPDADEGLDRPAGTDLSWDTVVGIEDIGEEPTYDATVPGTRNFIADGVVVHNSIEQDSDVVMFIYRDEVYNPESPDRGTAEVLVAKHRNGPTGIARLAFLDHYARFANMARV